jgi:ubiquinone/menaquinone biosynthesis C-methylase UbiE
VNFERASQDYERIQVPAIFAPWALDLLSVAAPRRGERALDVACGTGIVARLAAPRLGAEGRLAAVDLSEGMLASARAQPLPQGAPIEWQQGDAAALPFDADSFDVVLCQQGLQHMADRAAAAREMWRVLAPGGRAIVSVFSYRGDQELWIQVAGRHIGTEAAARFRGPAAHMRTAELPGLFTQAGFDPVQAETRRLSTRFPSVDVFVDAYLYGRTASVFEHLTADQRASLLADARAAFAPYCSDQGLAFPQQALVIVAHKPASAR